MARTIIKAPDGTYCIWSSIVEDIILYGATKNEILNFYQNEYGRSGKEFAEKNILEIESGNHRMTFAEAMEERTWNKSKEALNSDKAYSQWIKQQEILIK